MAECLPRSIACLDAYLAGLATSLLSAVPLSQLSPDALETLKDTEFNVFLAKVKHAEAKILENKAGENLKTARLTLDSKNLHLLKTVNYVALMLNLFQKQSKIKKPTYICFS